MTDVSTTPRRRLSPRERLAVFESAKGICCECKMKIAGGERWIVEHVRALGMGGDDAPHNMRPAHERCAEKKTNGPAGDLARIAKAKRTKVKDLGLHESKRPLPCGRRSRWKKKITGEVVPR